MPDVIDFIVLRQTFECAVRRNWKIGQYLRLSSWRQRVFQIRPVLFLQVISSDRSLTMPGGWGKLSVKNLSVLNFRTVIFNV